jgi:hypothetical protein
VATDAAGDVFVANEGNNTVEEFSRAGVLLRTLSSGISEPNSVATDAAGDVFVANFRNATVEEFSPAGALLRTLSTGIIITFGVATDAAGDVFVTNYFRDTVEEFAATGAFLRTLSTGINSEPDSVATDAAGDAFVANFGNNTVEEFSAAGALVRTLSSGIDEPESVATDAAGDVFVANFGNSTVEEFSPAGVRVQTLSSGIAGPRSVATDAAGDVFVANKGNNTLEEFSPTGALVRTLSSGIRAPNSVATDAAGDVFVANAGNNTVEEFAPIGVTTVSDASTNVAATSPITLSGFTTNGVFSDTAMIAPFDAVIVSDTIPYDQVSATIAFVAANGTLSGSSLSAGVVSGGTVTYSLSATTAAALQAELRTLTFTPTQGADGATVTTAFDLTVSDVTASPPTTPSATLSSGISNPASVATDAAGDVFVANEGNNTVEEFSPAGAVVRTLSSGISEPDSVATDAAGDVFVANLGSNTVEEFSSAGALVQTLSSGVNFPESVATDAAGDVFVANFVNSTVEEFSPAGALVQTLSSGISEPVSVATDVAGDVFVANQGSNAVEEFSAAGALLRTLSSGISVPVSVATDAAGDVFVANQGSNAVKEFSAAGALLRTLSSGISTPQSLATDAAGDVFVANQGSNAVEEFSAAGALVQTLSGGISGPQSVATDAAGDVFVGNRGNNTVEEFAPIGVTTISDNTTTVNVSNSAVAPTIAGTKSGQTTTSEAPISPFSGVTIGDANAGATDTLTIELFGPGKLADVATPGDLTRIKVVGGGGSPTSAYSLSTLSGSPDTITSELDALVFAPVNGTPNTSVATGFTLIDDSSAGTEATDATTTVIDSDPALPTIMGTVANQATTSEATVMPFAGVTIGDTNAGAADTLTIQLFGVGALADGATAGDLTELLSSKQGPGFPTSVTSLSTLSGSPDTITSELDALVFTPVNGTPNTSVTTGFTLIDDSSAGTEATDTTTTVIDTDPAAGYYYSSATNSFIPAPAGYYIPNPGSTSAAAEIEDPAGTYSAAGSAAALIDPAGTFSDAGAAAPTTDPAGTYSPSGSAAAIADPAGTFSGAGAAAPTTDPAGTYSPSGSAAAIADPAGTFSGAGAGAPTTDPAGTYSPSGSAAALIDPAGTFSGQGAAAPTPASPGHYVPSPGAAAQLETEPGYYQPNSGATTEIAAQPGFYVPTAGASAETPVDPGYYQPYAAATSEFLALAPTIHGAVPGQTTISEGVVKPFSSVIIADPNIDTTDTLTIILSGSGTLTDGTGFSRLQTTGIGAYALSGTATTITSELEALLFTPVDGVPNTSVTTTFTLSDKSSVYGAPTVNSATTVKDSDPAVPPTSTIGETVTLAAGRSPSILVSGVAADVDAVLASVTMNGGSVNLLGTDGDWAYSQLALGSGSHSYVATITDKLSLHSSVTGSVVTVNNANNVALAGTIGGDTVNASTGNSQIGVTDTAANGGRNSINATNGNNQVAISDGAGHNTVNASGGNNAVTINDASGGNNTLSASGGNNRAAVSDGAGHNTVNASGGNNTVTINDASGGGNLLSAGGGDNSIKITDTLGKDSITLAGGNNAVTIGGLAGGDTIAADTNDTFTYTHLLSHYDTLNNVFNGGTSSNDVFNLSAIAGVTKYQGTITGGTLNADSVGCLYSSAQHETSVFVNTTGAAESLTGASAISPMLELAGSGTLTAANFKV